MWMMKAPDGGLNDTTGMLFGRQVVNGHVLVGSYCDFHWFQKMGFTDATPETLKPLYKFPQRLLIARHGGIGDLLMLTPVLREVKRRSPSTRISFYAVSTSAVILQGNPNIDEWVLNRVITEGARYYDDYDDVYDYTHTVEFNREAQRTNNYVHSLERMGLSSDRPTPDLYLMDWEREAARKELFATRQVKQARFKVGLCLHASTELRSIPEDRRVAVVDYFASKHPEWEIICYANTLPKHPVSPFACPRCKAEGWVQRNPGISGVTMPCPKCKTKLAIEYTEPKWPNVYNIGHSLPLRSFAASIGLLDFLVTVDTGAAHIAGAFRLPQLVLEGPFDGHVTVGTLPNTHVFQRDFPCAPCFRHTSPCQRMGILSLDYPPCMGEYKPAEILNRVESILKTDYRNVLHPVYDLDLSKISLTPRPCPLCGNVVSERDNFVARKGKLAFYECKNCEAVFSNKHPDDPAAIYQDPAYAIAYQDKAVWDGVCQIGHDAERVCRELSGLQPPGLVLDLGCNNGRLLLGFKEAGWETWGADWNEAPLKMAREQGAVHTLAGDVESLVAAHPKELDAIMRARWGRKKGKPPLTPPVLAHEGKILVRTNAFTTITMSHIIEHLRDPARILQEVRRALIPRGCLWIATPDGDAGRPISGMMEWCHINNLVAGEHVIIFTRKTLTSCLIGAGLEPSGHWERNIPDCMWTVAQKKKPEPLDPTLSLPPSHYKSITGSPT